MKYDVGTHIYIFLIQIFNATLELWNFFKVSIYYRP